MATRKWEDAPYDLVSKIATHFTKLDEIVRLRLVCKSWQAAVPIENFQFPNLREHIPYLILAGEGEEREFYSIIEHKVVATISRPCLKNSRCIESLGWLLAVGIDGHMTLLNPVTGFEIELPHYRTFPYVAGPLPSLDIMKMALSSAPDKISNYAVMVIGGTHNLGFWRPGDGSWNAIQRINGPVCDITYSNGKFYVIETIGLVSEFDLTGSDPKKGRLIANNQLLDQTFSISEISDMNLYICEFSGELLVILRDCRQPNIQEGERNFYYYTFWFYIYTVDVSSGEWKELENLGSKAVFIGYNQTMLIDTFEFCEFKANHIYYTTDFWNLWDQCVVSNPIETGLDVGVYNLYTHEIEPFYHGDENKLFDGISPSLWFFTPRFKSDLI